MPPARLPYTVVSSTGEDDGYSAEIELVKPGPSKEVVQLAFSITL